MDICEFDDYKKYTLAFVEDQPRQGYGYFRKISEVIGVHSVVVSQVLRGDRDFTLEQALELSQFIGHSIMEEEFFLLLVQRQRAGTVKLQKKLTEKIETLRIRSRDIEERIGADKKLTEADKAKFYSDWFYSAVRLSSSLPEMRDAKDLSEKLDLPFERVQKVLQFLLEKGLCRIEDGVLDMGARSTHLNASSPLAQRHHKNWRLKSMESMDRNCSEDFFFTSPFSLSEEAVEKIRNEIIRLIEESAKIVDPAPCETTYCLNIDWFRF